ncbi:hypothetical protein M231_02736 [Tremella mesenterica]|uniref:DNA repair and recombination protein RAD52 n=1 Tax=Tremella mesenterica TaxID=5217 RepID=A0A4Q1BPU3_TREME|nr:hypothetical protein M231_02736 [Tremella mesenterica]
MDPNDTTWMSHHGSVSGAGMSFGTAYASGSAFGQPSQGFGAKFTQWSEEKVATLQARLAKKLGPEYITQRPGPAGGPKLSYVEGWKVINLANQVFSFNGWSSSIVSLTTDFLDCNDQGRVSVNVTAIVRITLQDGCFHEDVGCGQCENVRGKGAALDKAKKEAVTDATKRALKTFGNLLGNCLYDKDYTKEIVKMKVPPAKFNVSDLERRPEFTEQGAGPSRPISAIPPNIPQPTRSITPNPGPIQKATIAPGTPLRVVEDTFGEMSDAEFLDFEGDSFLEQVDISTMAVETSNTINTTLPRHSTPHSTVQPPKVDVPVYQHRHRPDLPLPGIPAVAQPGTKFTKDSTFTRSRTLPETSSNTSTSGIIHAPPMNMQINGEPMTSSGGSSVTVPEPKVKPVGGFVYPQHNGTVPTSGASARLKAITSAMSTDSRPSPIHKPTSFPHTRTGNSSPRIPSGGVEAIAGKATSVFRSTAVHLGLDELSSHSTDLNTGFSSARGVKRGLSNGPDGESLHVSPSKVSRGGEMSGEGRGVGRTNEDGREGGVGGMNGDGRIGGGGGMSGKGGVGFGQRNGMRQALGELHDQGGEWKRSRAN